MSADVGDLEQPPNRALPVGDGGLPEPLPLQKKNLLPFSIACRASWR